jgi:adenylate cyclase
VGPSVMQELLREDKPPVLGGEMRSISLLFSDLQGFTTISETMPAPQLVGMLNEYFDVMLSIIDKYGGTLDKLMGDGIMAYFGAPRPYPDHAQRAVACALEMQEAMEKFREEEREKGLPPLFMRIGLHSGEAVVGLIGMKGRQNYSVTGDVVNVAARLEGLNKEFGTQVLMSEDTCKAADPPEPTVFRGETSVKGRVRPIPVYSIGPPQPGA